MTFTFDSINRNLPENEAKLKALHTALMASYDKARLSEDHQKKTFNTLLTNCQDITASDIIPPDPRVAIELLRASEWIASNTLLFSAYMALITASLDKQSTTDVHPAYAKLIQELSQDEIKLLHYCTTQKRIEYPIITIVSEDPKTKSQQLELKHYSNIAHTANCDHPGLSPIYLENLDRLGLAQFEPNVALNDETLYTDLLNSDYIQKVIQDITAQNKTPKHAKGIVSLTNFGMMFCSLIKL